MFDPAVRGSAAFVLGASLSAAGCTAEIEPSRASASGFGAYEVSLAEWSGGLIAAWYDTRNGNAEIYLRQIVGGNRVGRRDLRMTRTEEESFEPDIVPVAGGLALAWYEKLRNGSTDAQLALVMSNGAVAWQRRVGDGSSGSRNPVLASFDERLFVAWIQSDRAGGESVFAQWWSAKGRPIGAPTRLAPASSTTWNLNAAIDDTGIAHVVFDAAIGTRVEELFWSTVDGERIETRRLTNDDGRRSKYPDIVFIPGHAALTWFDDRHGNSEIYFCVVDYSKSVDTQDFESKATRVTDTPGDSIGGYLTSNAGRIGLTWSDNTKGAYDIFYQLFDETGVPLAAAAALTRTDLQSLIPAIVPWRTGFAIAWNEVDRSEPGYHSADTRSEVRYVLIP